MTIVNSTCRGLETVWDAPPVDWTHWRRGVSLGGVWNIVCRSRLLAAHPIHASTVRLYSLPLLYSSTPLQPMTRLSTDSCVKSQLITIVLELRVLYADIQGNKKSNTVFIFRLGFPLPSQSDPAFLRLKQSFLLEHVHGSVRFVVATFRFFFWKCSEVHCLTLPYLGPVCLGPYPLAMHGCPESFQLFKDQPCTG